MEKTSNEANKRVSAIKELLKREHLTREKLASKLTVPGRGDNKGELVPMEAQNLSRRLVSGDITEHICRQIHDLFPHYRLEWLLGYDDNPTNKELLLASIDQQSKESNLLDKGFFSYLELYGYEVTEGSFDDSGNPLSNTIRKAHRGVTISRDGKSVTLPLFPLIDFQNEIGEYIELRLKHMMK